MTEDLEGPKHPRRGGQVARPAPGGDNDDGVGIA
jgi:hypothetical protein